MSAILNNRILVIMIILIILLILIKNRRSNICRILMISTSLFLLPFILYTYPDQLINLLILLGGSAEFQILLNFLIVASTTLVIMGVIIKINIKPLSKNSMAIKESNEHIRLKEGRSLLQYSIWYTLYITIIHVPICFFVIVVSSFSPMVIIYAPYMIFALFIMYAVSMVMSINGAIRVKGKIVLKVVILMFIPLVNFIMMIKLSYEAKKTLEGLDTNFN
ncbi:hypothetical protein [Inconstantimicrobium mannanitabidum]|uniref:Uncharacterized protein n=1 Tax=Inconstantimicrobium mannanitabidum TaxID=1604901 RepID=A0ACB5RIQ5_9CLOT|nr:hypothetical protein [Clostridium sp. TW13]GKX69016.1 hypothetical protein rsdtw13_42740 [Clostridium sp. TW13]